MFVVKSAMLVGVSYLAGEKITGLVARVVNIQVGVNIVIQMSSIRTKLYVSFMFNR